MLQLQKVWLKIDSVHKATCFKIGRAARRSSPSVRLSLRHVHAHPASPVDSLQVLPECECGWLVDGCWSLHVQPHLCPVTAGMGSSGILDGWMDVMLSWIQ